MKTSGIVKKALLVFIAVMAFFWRGGSAFALDFGLMDGVPIPWTSYGNSTYTVDGGGVLRSNNTNSYSSTFVSNSAYGPGAGDFVFAMEHACSNAGDGGYAWFGWDVGEGTPNTGSCQYCNWAKTGVRNDPWTAGYTAWLYSGAHQNMGSQATPCNGVYRPYKFIVKKVGGGAFIFMGSTLLHFNPDDIGSLAKRFTFNTQSGSSGVYSWKNFVGTANGPPSPITITPGAANYYLKTGGSITITATVTGYTGSVLWNIYIINTAGAVVRTYTGTGDAISQAWDGKNASLVDQPTGDYTAYIIAWDDLIAPQVSPVLARIVPPPSHTVTALSPFIGTASFDVQWTGIDAGQGIAGYNVQYKDITAAGAWQNWMMATIAVTGNFGLGVEGHQYGFRVQTTDNFGVSDSYDADPGGTTTTLDFTAPTSSVTALSQYSTSANFTVNWSGNDPVSGVKQYDVQYKDGAGGAWTDWKTGFAGTSDTFNGADGHTYYFQSRATDNANNIETYPGGDGDTSTTVDAAPPTSSVSALSQYTSIVNFTVNWGGDDGAGSGINRFDVQYKDGTDGIWINWKTATLFTSDDFSGTPGHTYYFQSRLSDIAGNLEAYPGGDGDTNITVDTLPPTSSVTALSQYSTTANFTVNWSGDDPDGSGVNLYDVQYKDGGEGVWTDWKTETANTSDTFTGVTGHTYYFQSRAVDNAGNGESYDDGAGDTNITVDSVPPTSSVTALSQYSTTVDFPVGWSGSDALSGVSLYDVQYKDGAGGSWTDWKTAFAGTSDTFNGASGHTYYFQSRATDIAGSVETYPGGDGDTYIIVDAAPPTSSVTALAQYTAATSFTVEWSGNDALSGLDLYDVQYKDGADGVWVDWQTDTADTSAVFNGIAGLTYYFQSRATDNLGNVETYPGGDGDTNITIDAVAPTSSVTALSQYTAATSFAVNWSGSDALSGVNLYDVQYKDGAGGVWTDWKTAFAGTSDTFNGATGHTYYFQSKAADGVGNAETYPGGDGDTSITVDAVAPTSSVTALAQYSSSANFTVNWSGSDALSGVNLYDVQYKDGAGGAWTDWKTAFAGTSDTFNGIDGHAYYFQSRATDNVGNAETYPGGDGDTNITVDAVAPTSSVTALSQYTAATSFTVNWSGSDALSGVNLYDVQYKDGASGAWTDWKTAFAGTSATFNGTNGHAYYFQSRAADIAGNVETYPGGDGDANTIVDTSILSPPGSIGDGASGDADFTASTASLSGNWTAVPGAVKYFYGIGTSQTNPDVFPWTDNNTSVSATAGALNLTSGTTYYFLVKSRNVSGVDGQAGSSDGITVDTAAPASAVGALSQYSSTANFTVNWSGNDALSGVSLYDVQYKDGAGGTWTDWKTATANTSDTFNGADGHTYYFQSRATDGTGNIEAYPGANGDANITVDTAPPTSSVTALSQYSATANFTVNWSGSDALSGVTLYDVQYKDSAGGAWTDWKTAFAGTSAAFNGTNGHTYYFQSRATDNAGNVEAYPGGDGDANTTVETSILAAPASLNDGTAGDADFAASAASLSGNWAAVPGANKYFYGIGTTPTNPDVSAWTDNGANTSATVGALNLTNGTTYYFLVKARNLAGIDGQAGSSDGITVDTAAPTSAVAALAQYSATSSFTVNWSGSDALSGVKQYDVQYRAGSGGVWTDWKTATTDTSGAFSGANGNTYYFQSRATDNIGNVESYPGGDGDAHISVDTSILGPPGSISDGAAADVDFTSSSTSLSGNWTAAPGAVKYFYGVGTTKANPDVFPWTNNGTNTSATVGSLSLANGAKYYFLVKAVNVSGIDGQVGSSNGITVDKTPPVSSVAALSRYVATTDFTVTWSGSDALSGVKRFDVQYKDGTGGAWTNWKTATTETSGAFSGANGHAYYFQSRAADNVGNVEAYPGGNGDANTTVETTLLPAPAFVNDGAGEDKDYTSSATTLAANWAAVAGADKYSYAVGLSAADTSVIPWTDNGTNTTVTVGGIALSHNKVYYIHIRAINKAGIPGQTGVSDGVRVDFTPPAAPMVADGGSEATDTKSLRFTLAATDAESPVVNYEYSLGTSPTANDVLDWTSGGPDGSFAVDGLSLIFGTKYFIRARATNAAGLTGGVGVSDGITVLKRAAIAFSFLPADLTAFSSPGKDASVQVELIFKETGGGTAKFDQLKRSFTLPGGAVIEEPAAATSFTMQPSDELHQKTTINIPANVAALALGGSASAKVTVTTLYTGTDASGNSIRMPVEIPVTLTTSDASVRFTVGDIAITEPASGQSAENTVDAKAKVSVTGSGSLSGQWLLNGNPVSEFKQNVDKSGDVIVSATIGPLAAGENTLSLRISMPEYMESAAVKFVSQGEAPAEVKDFWAGSVHVTDARVSFDKNTNAFSGVGSFRLPLSDITVEIPFEKASIEKVGDRNVLTGFVITDIKGYVIDVGPVSVSVKSALLTGDGVTVDGSVSIRGANGAPGIGPLYFYGLKISADGISGAIKLDSPQKGKIGLFEFGIESVEFSIQQAKSLVKAHGWIEMKPNGVLEFNLPVVVEATSEGGLKFGAPGML